MNDRIWATWLPLLVISTPVFCPASKLRILHWTDIPFPAEWLGFDDANQLKLQGSMIKILTVGTTVIKLE